MTQIRDTLIRMLWEKTWAKSPWHDKFHLINKASLEADYGTFADEILRAVEAAPAKTPTEIRRPIACNEMATGDLFNELLTRIDFDGMDPRTFSLAELQRAILGAEFPA